MVNDTEKVDLLLNGVVDIKNGGLMVNYTGKMVLLLNM
jgi:hypothetical protein